MPIERGFLTVREAAETLGLTQSAIRRAIFDGTMEAEKIGRRLNVIAPEAVDRYRREHLGRKGWDKRRDPGLQPSPRALEGRAYRARKRAAQETAGETSGTTSKDAAGSVH